MSPTKLLLALCLIASFNLQGQSGSSLDLKWEPKLSFTAKLSPRWTYNLQVMGLQFFENTDPLEESPNVERIDFRGYLSYRFLRGAKLTGGYMYRKTNPLELESGFEHRLSAFYSFQSYAQAWRLAHRFITEMRFRPTINEGRLRYRFSGDIPLQGEKLDVGELYFLSSDELVMSIGEDYLLVENRFAASLGWQISKTFKVELGGEFRLRNPQSPNALHIVTNCYINL